MKAHTEIELVNTKTATEIVNEKKLATQRVDLAIGAFDSMNLSAIFSLFLWDVGSRFMEETGRFFMFPIAAMSSGIRAVLAWRQASLENGKNGSVARAAVETAGAIAITTAVVGGLVGAAGFALAASVIFTAVLAAKTLFHLGSAAYYWGKSVATTDPVKKAQYRSMSYGNAVGTVALALATVAVGFVMLAAKPIIAVLGILAGVIATTYGIYKLVTSYKSAKPAQKTPESPRSQSSAALLKNAFTHSPKLGPQAAVAASPKRVVVGSAIVREPAPMGSPSKINLFLEQNNRAIAASSVQSQPQVAALQPAI